MQRRAFLVAAAALPTTLSSIASAAIDPLAQELLRLENERQAAYVAGDRAVLERHFAAEYVHTNLHGGRTNRQAELDFYAPGKFSLDAGRTENITTHRYGDIATLIGTVVWENATYRATPTNSIDLSGRFSVSRVYAHRDGRWQLALSHASLVFPPTAT
jgi:type II secretory pathway pseudopilin PulG